MSKPIRFAFLLALVLFMPLFARQARAERSEDALGESNQNTNATTTTTVSTEILPDGHKIINIADDFLTFWDAAKGKPIRRQRLLWTKMVESKYPDYFNNAVYRNADLDTRHAMLDNFLQSVPAHIDAIKDFNKKAAQSVIDGMADFEARFPDYQQQRDIYVGLSLFSFDAAVRPVSNKVNVLDTLCLAADVLSSYSQDQLKITIVHELFHLYNFQFLFGSAYQLNHNGLVFQQDAINRLIAAYVPLMVEGMAVAASQEIYPGKPLNMYLHLSEEELADQQEDMSQNALFFLNMMRTGALPSQYEVWFSGEYEGIPRRGGYFLGYEASKRVLEKDTLEDMARMSPTELGLQADTELSAMITDKVFVMSDQ